VEPVETGLACTEAPQERFTYGLMGTVLSGNSCVTPTMSPKMATSFRPTPLRTDLNLPAWKPPQAVTILVWPELYRFCCSPLLGLLSLITWKSRVGPRLGKVCMISHLGSSADNFTSCESPQADPMNT